MLAKETLADRGPVKTDCCSQTVRGAGAYGPGPRRLPLINGLLHRCCAQPDPAPATTPPAITWSAINELWFYGRANCQSPFLPSRSR